jgi:hypothetical protein
MAVFDIETLRARRGSLTKASMSKVVEWGLAKRSELLDNWDRSVAREPLRPIQPLGSDRG